MMVPNLTRAYDNNGRCPRQKFVFGILQLNAMRVKLYNIYSNDTTNKRCLGEPNICGHRTTVCLSAWTSACLPTYLYVCLSVCLPACLSVSLTIYICLSVCLNSQ